MYVAVRGSLDPVPADGITLGEVLLKGIIELRDRTSWASRRMDEPSYGRVS